MAKSLYTRISSFGLKDEFISFAYHTVLDMKLRGCDYIRVDVPVHLSVDGTILYTGRIYLDNSVYCPSTCEVYAEDYSWISIPIDDIEQYIQDNAIYSV